MHENPILLSEALQFVPGSPTRYTLWRWFRRGVITASGTKVKLRCTQVGGRIYTTEAAVKKFLREVAEAGSDHFSQTEGRYPAPN